MIGVIFQFGDETVEVRIIDSQVLFRTSTFGSRFTDISGLKLDKKGVLKEYPELKGKDDWKKIAIKKFKHKIKKMESEKERVKYIISDLTKHGYKPRYIQKAGFRPIKIQ